MMQTEADEKMLESIRPRLTLFQNLWLSQQLEPPAVARARLLKMRNAAICKAKEYCPGPNAAKAIEAALDRFAVEWWTPEEGLRPINDGAPLRDRLLHKILELNGGETLGWRRIHDVLNERPAHE